MRQGPWKQGQSCKVGKRWGWVFYLLPKGEAIVSFDDGSQETVKVGDLVDPVVGVYGGNVSAGKGVAK